MIEVHVDVKDQNLSGIWGGKIIHFELHLSNTPTLWDLEDLWNFNLIVTWMAPGRGRNSLHWLPEAFGHWSFQADPGFSQGSCLNRGVGARGMDVVQRDDCCVLGRKQLHLFWNRKTFPSCQPQTNQSEGIIWARLLRKVLGFFRHLVQNKKKDCWSIKPAEDSVGCVEENSIHRFIIQPCKWDCSQKTLIQVLNTNK